MYGIPVKTGGDIIYSMKRLAVGVDAYDKRKNKNDFSMPDPTRTSLTQNETNALAFVTMVDFLSFIGISDADFTVRINQALRREVEKKIDKAYGGKEFSIRTKASAEVQKRMDAERENEEE